MGAGEWENPSRIPFTSNMNMNTPVSDNAHQNSTFIIGWIKVENKQGEDKGITIIYPTSLCLSYIPFSTPRMPLDYIPELPAPLQPSPQVPIGVPSASAVTQSGSPPIANSMGTFAALHLHRPSFLTSPTSESLHSFRSLTLSKSRDFRQVATEVGGYVDAVARERERERERLKREREGGPSSSPKLARTTATTPASVPTPMAVDVATISAPAPVSLATQVSPPVAPGSTNQQHLQPPMPGQNAYPSPPQSNPIVVPASGEKSSPVVDATAPFPPAAELPTTATAAVLAPPLPIVSTISGSNGYDPFGPIETTWSQPAQNYLGMDMDMDFGMDDMGMNFGLNMASVTNNSTSRTAYNDSRANIEFEDAFTDDDFSFFDRPSRAAAVANPPTFTQSRIASGSGTHPLSVSSLPAGTAMSPPLFGDINLSGPGPPNHNQQMWTPGGFMEGFTPRSVDHNDSIPPDLLPSSPGQTPDTHSAPATPNVHLEYNTAIKRSSTSDLFEPIPFAPYHRATDGKYAFGKFALPSPPAEDNFAESVSISLPPSRNGSSSWRCQYDAITDPRIAVVRKLIGVKRKTNFQQGARSPPRKSLWVEEWKKPASEKDDGPGVKSDLESDDDEEDLDDVDSPLMSRPTTPAPAYLPLGPTLLHTQFQHSQLLPLSTSLRPPGAAVAPINLIATNPPLSVPTPVSPAATMGQASEKSKSLEAAAFAVAAEVVENPIWAEAWRANIVGAKPTPAVWSTDIKAVSQLLEAVPSLEAPVDIVSLFGLGKSTFGS
jgi:mediator of RNA polymerase II transcription subunit 13, fungi type